MIDSLKGAFMKDNKDMLENCHMTDSIIPYAFGELGTNESAAVKEHLTTCRSCLNLYMDLRMAEEDAKEIKNEPVKMLPGLQQAIDKKKKLVESPFKKIIATIFDFFDKGFSLKPVATFATVVLVVFVGIYVFQDSGSYNINIMMHGRSQTGFRGGQREYNDFLVESGGMMNSGDYFRFQTKINKDAYVYIVFYNSSGNIESMQKGFIGGEKDFILPDDNKWFHLDENTGMEKLYLLASKNKIDDFEKRIDELKTGGIETIEKVFPKTTIQSFYFKHQ